jgi:hypothetical protein
MSPTEKPADKDDKEKDAPPVISGDTHRPAATHYRVLFAVVDGYDQGTVHEAKVFGTKANQARLVAMGAIAADPGPAPEQPA